MYNPMRIIIATLFIFFILSDLSAQMNRDSLLQKIMVRLDSVPDGFAISIATIKDDKVEFIGLIKESDTIILSDLRDSLFEIGSLTKVFTSTVLANEVINGSVRLTDRINKVYPYTFNDKIKLNYLSLANHTSGVYRLPSNILPLLYKNPSNPYSEYSYEMFDSFLKENLQLENTDHSKYSYSNLGAGLLAYSLSKQRKLEFDELLRRIVFEKYSMNSTSYEVKTSFSGLKPDGTKADNWQFNGLKGAGGLVSTAHDLSKFINAQFNVENKELCLTREETFSISDKMSIGLGWHILESNTAEEKYWHNGGTGGFTSSISYRTSNNTGVIVLSNISALSSKSFIIDEIGFELLELIK